MTIMIMPSVCICVSVSQIPANSGNNPENITSTASSIHQLQHRGDGGNTGPRVTYDKGYSSGGVASIVCAAVRSMWCVQGTWRASPSG